LLADLNSHWGHLEPSRSHPHSLRLQSGSDNHQLRLNIHCIIPKPFCEYAGPDPYLLLVSVGVAELTPHAGLSTYDPDVLHLGGEVVDVPPFDVVAVGYSVAIAEALIDVGDIVG
jgi:hypothetical protein